MVGGGKRRQQAASWVLLPWRGSFLCDPWQAVCLGPTYGSGEGFLGRISTQGGKGRLVTIPVVWGTPGKLLQSRGQPHRNRRTDPYPSGECVLKKPLVPPSCRRPWAPRVSPEDTSRNFLLFLSHLVEPRLMAVPRHLLWSKSLK